MVPVFARTAVAAWAGCAAASAPTESTKPRRAARAAADGSLVGWITSAPEIDDVAEVEDLEVRAEVLEFRVEVRESAEAAARGVVVAREVARLIEEVEEALLHGGLPAQGHALEAGLAEKAGLGVAVAFQVPEAQVEQRVHRVASGPFPLERPERLVHEGEALGDAVEGDEAIAEVVAPDGTKDGGHALLSLGPLERAAVDRGGFLEAAVDRQQHARLVVAVREDRLVAERLRVAAGDAIVEERLLEIAAQLVDARRSVRGAHGRRGTRRPEQDPLELDEDVVGRAHLDRGGGTAHVHPVPEGRVVGRARGLEGPVVGRKRGGKLALLEQGERFLAGGFGGGAEDFSHLRHRHRHRRRAAPCRPASS